MLSGSDRTAALAQYRRRAGGYDLERAVVEPVRRAAIGRLARQSGERVLDVGCRTGLSFVILRQSVGATGSIVGIEQSTDMMAKARERVALNHRSKITLLCSPVETAAIAGHADAALFHFTHDILRQPEAIANVMRHLKTRARVVACGLKWADAWALPVNVFVLLAASYSTTTLQGLYEPWSGLAR